MTRARHAALGRGAMGSVSPYTRSWIPHRTRVPFRTHVRKGVLAASAVGLAGMAGLVTADPAAADFGASPAVIASFTDGGSSGTMGPPPGTSGGPGVPPLGSTVASSVGWSYPHKPSSGARHFDHTAPIHKPGPCFRTPAGGRGGVRETAGCPGDRRGGRHPDRWMY